MKTKLFAIVLLFVLPLYGQLLEVEKVPPIALPVDEIFISPDGNTLFAGNISGLSVFNISDIYNPVYISTLEMPKKTFCRSVLFYGNYLIVGTGLRSQKLTMNGYPEYYLLIYDITDLKNPQLISETDFNRMWPVANLWLHEGYLLIHAGGAILTYDISDIYNPVQKAIFQYPTNTFRFNDVPGVLVENNLYVFGRDNIKSLNVEDPLNIEEESRIYFIDESVVDIKHYNYYDPLALLDFNYLIVLTMNDIKKIDIGDPANITMVNSLLTGGSNLDLDIYDNYAYATLTQQGENLLKIFNIDREDEVELLDSVAVYQGNESFVIHKNNLVFLEKNNQFTLYSIANAVEPVFEKTLSYGWDYLLYEYDNKLIGVKNSKLIAFEYNNFSDFTAIEVYDIEMPDRYIFKKAKVQNNTLYSYQYNKGLVIYDISDRLTPEIIYTTPDDTEPPDDYLLTENENFLITTKGDSLFLNDFSDKINLKTVHSLKFNEYVGGEYVSGNTLMVNDKDGMHFYNIDYTNENLAYLNSLSGVNPDNGYGEIVYSIDDTKILITHSENTKIINFADINNITITDAGGEILSIPAFAEFNVVNDYIFVTNDAVFGIYHFDKNNDEISLVYEESFDIDGISRIRNLFVSENKVIYDFASYNFLYNLDFITDVDDEPITEALPETFELHQNYPNPFNPSTVISFNLPNAGWTELSVYDPLGRKVETLISGNMNAGTYQVTFNAAGYPSGVYIYRMQYRNTLNKEFKSQSAKMLLLK